MNFSRAGFLGDFYWEFFFSDLFWKARFNIAARPHPRFFIFFLSFCEVFEAFRGRSGRGRSLHAWGTCWYLEE